MTNNDVPAWREWLRQVWDIAGFAEAVGVASAELAAEIQRQTATSPPACDEWRVRRLVETVMRYLLRWSGRATPFGLFAGVAPIKLGGHAQSRWGGQHQPVLRLDGEAVDTQVRQREQRLEVLRTADVMTNSLGFARGSSWVIPSAGEDDGDRLSDVEIDLTRPVLIAIEAARQPIAFSDLAAKLAAEAPTVEIAAIEKMLAELVARRVLVSAVRPPMTVTDPQNHLASYGEQPAPTGRLVADARVDCSVTLPTSVLREAERAASALARLAPPTSEPWQAYHQAFLERYGPGAAIPVRELVSGSGLGYPSGYRGSRRREPLALTSRDTVLTTLAQRAALDGHHEVVLDEELLTELTAGQRVPVPHTELRFSLVAPTRADLDSGAFTLSVVSGAWHAGVTVGRFLHLLTETEHERFRRAYQDLPTAMPGAIRVQISGPPLARKMASVAAVPATFPVLPLGEFQQTPGITVDDLAVTADARRLLLVSRSDGRPVEPMLFTAVNLRDGQQPLTRFLTEIWTSFSAPCRPFSWGPLASTLPFLPRIRHGRSVLHSARWVITAAQLPKPTAPFSAWRAAWEQLRESYDIPPAVFLGANDKRIRLDLDEPAHLGLLRSHLSDHASATLTEASGEAGWLDGRAHEVVLTLARSHEAPTPDGPRHVLPGSAVEHQPGCSPWLYAKLYGRCEDILAQAAQLDALAGSGWWFLRYHEPEPHLRLRIPLENAAQFGAMAERLGQWTAGLRASGLLRDYTINTYRPETRFGAGATLTAAEAVFAADSHAVVQRLSGDREILTAAGLIRIAEGFTDNGPRWLINHVDHHAGTPADQRPIGTCRERVLRTLPTLDDQELQHALADYRAHTERDGLDTNRILADLLHLHHARMIGVDPDSERYCVRLARAASQTLLARGAS